MTNRLAAAAVLSTVTLVLPCGMADAVHAATLHHYRFESGGFLTDSAGSAALTAGGSGTQVGLPSGVRGQDFPSEFAGIGNNSSAADFAGQNTNGLFTNGSTALGGDFTIEAFVHPDTVAPVGVANQIASQGSAGGAANFSWIMALAGSIGGVPGELGMSISDGSTVFPRASGFVLTPGSDYFVAASVDVSGGQITFHVQNLTAGTPLQSSIQPHGASSLNGLSRFQIGDYNGFANSSFDGLIDEVRLSNEVLPVNQLLVNQIVPEPSNATLFATAAVLLLSYLGAGPGRGVRSSSIRS